MARRKKNGFDTTMLQKYADQIEAAGGSGALRWAVASNLEAAKMELNRQITARMQPSNLPAGGKYSTGDTLESLDKHYRTQWDGNIASMPLGFDLDKSGVVSLVLMYGTPKMSPVPGLNDTLKGKVARKKVRESQERAMKMILETIHERAGK